MTAESIVYFIRGTESGRIKIGTTTGWAKARLDALQIGSPEPLEWLCNLPGGRDAERALHAEFAAYRLHGEWFAPNPKLLGLISAAQKRAAVVRAIRAEGL